MMINVEWHVIKTWDLLMCGMKYDIISSLFIDYIHTFDDDTCMVMWEISFEWSLLKDSFSLLIFGLLWWKN